jgi:hypothetical protein
LCLVAALFGILAFGINLEQRTALRRVPMTDLGVYVCAAWAVGSGDDTYTIRDWHGWHYGYPPALAILFRPLAQPPPPDKPVLPPGTARTEANTPWGYGIDSHQRFYGLHRENFRFFIIVAVWYFLSVSLAGLSAHALACGLEGRRMTEGLPVDAEQRRWWWALRGIPLLVCAGSIGTDFSRGQVDVLMLAAIALALYLVTVGHHFKAGAFLSVPAAIKLFPALVLLYPLWRRQWRLSLGVITGLLFLLVLLPTAAFGPKQTVELYRTWIHVLAKPAVGLGTDTSRREELTGMNGTDNQSLLAFIHNWQYHDLPRKKRPAEAAPAARQACYVVGVLMLLGAGIVSGFRKQDSTRELFIIVGLLVGVALVINPVIHNFYYLLLLPLVAALLDGKLTEAENSASVWKLPLVLWVFMLTDLLARLPTIGPRLRDWGLPLLSMVWMLGAGAAALLKAESKQTTFTSLENTSEVSMELNHR